MIRKNSSEADSSESKQNASSKMLQGGHRTAQNLNHINARGHNCLKVVRPSIRKICA
jgi:hypothetical protein